LTIANKLNEYFLDITGSFTVKSTVDKDAEGNPLQYLFKHYTKPFDVMKWSYTSSKEISDIREKL
jgi:hypothetical protein